MRYAIFILSAFLLLTLPSYAQSRQTIVWATYDFAPFFITSGPYKNLGTSDQLIKFYQDALPQYDHRLETINLARLNYLAQHRDGELICMPLLLKTPQRQSFLTYSQALKPAYGHVLISKRSMNDKYDVFSLTDYLENTNNTLTIQKYRSYGHAIDAILKTHAESTHVQQDDFTTEQLYQLIKHGRIDAFIDTETSVTYEKRMQFLGDEYFYTPIDEDQLERFGYTACTNSASGKQAIQDINQVLQDQDHTIRIQKIIESWVSPKNLKKFQDFYRKNIALLQQ